MPHTLIFRPIDVARDSDVLVRHMRDAMEISFGRAGAEALFDRMHYCSWVGKSVVAYPEGNVLAFDGETCAGQLNCFVLPASQRGYIGQGMLGYINLYYLTPEYRGRRYGDQIQRYAEDFFRQRGVRAVELSVAATNERALAFYERVGFRAVGEERRQGYLVLRMRQELAPILR